MRIRLLSSTLRSGGPASDRATAGRRRAKRTVSGLTATLLAGVAAATLVSTPAEAATVQIIEKQSPRNSSTYKEVWVPCPDQTMRGISGDFQLSGPKSIKINAVVPSSGGVWFLASESTATSEDWSYFARAYCSPVAGLPGLEYKVRSAYFSGARSDTPDSLSTNLNCPVGKGIIGMGAWVRYQDGTPNKPPQNKIVLTTLYARHTGQFDNTGNAGASAQHSGFNGDWELELTAVCVNQVSGLTTDGGWGLESGDTAYDEVRCPGATKVHAVGFYSGYDPTRTPVHISFAWSRSSRQWSTLSGYQVNLAARQSTYQWGANVICAY